MYGLNAHVWFFWYSAKKEVGSKVVNTMYFFPHYDFIMKRDHPPLEDLFISSYLLFLQYPAANLWTKFVSCSFVGLGRGFRVQGRPLQVLRHRPALPRECQG